MSARALFALVALAIGVAVAAAQQSLPPWLYTNEADLDEVDRVTTLDIKDPVAVFGFVLGSLPDRVRVLPTENYYYFRFTLNGAPYAGNVRLAIGERDQGKINIAYNEQPSDWRTPPDVYHAVLDASQGVTVEKLDPLTYRVARGWKSVTFALNDLSQVKPPPGLLGPDEAYLGPIFDESGIRFFLVVNSRLKLFHYLLDETDHVSEEFFPAAASDRVLIGKRTGFAFYRGDGGRKTLIAVNERNSRLNTPFDGPFDQLPDNFIEGETLREAIELVSPEVKGRIDRLGNFIGRKFRYSIHPYLLYRQESDLAIFHRCMTSRQVKPDNRALCFVIDDDEAQRPNPRPQALKRR